MQATIKNALVTTATVLVVIYIANQISVSRDLVRRALNG